MDMSACLRKLNPQNGKDQPSEKIEPRKVFSYAV